ncbi:SDR family NAD(P)-dependent oxidoreductase [Bacteroidota bacterium]
MKIILITGTSKGIGNYLANYYLEQGNIVIGCSRSDTIISNNNYHHFTIDISNENEILELFKEIRKKFKKLNVLINNAAINPSISPLAFIPKNIIQSTFETNVIAPMIFCREAIKLMSKAKNGRIVNMSSMAMKHEVAGESIYTSSKAALSSFSRVLAKEVYKLGITVNVIAPSVIKTSLSDKIDQIALQSILNRNAVTSYGKMQDVSNSIDYLIQENSKTITGQIIYLGGV